MTTKEWFSRGLRLNTEIDRMIVTRDAIKAKALSVTASYDGVVVDGTKDPHSKMDRLAEYEHELDTRIDEYVNVMLEIEEVIGQISDARYRIVLRERYCNNAKWEDIREIMGYRDVRNVYTLHGKALLEAGKKISL